MRKRIGFVLGCVAAAAALALVCGRGLVAQSPRQPEPAAKQSKQPDEVVGTAKKVKTSWGDKKTVLMQGEVVFTHGDTVFKSDEVTWDEAAKIATSPGRIVITDPEIDITGDKGVGYFKKRLGVVEGSVTITLKPSEQPEDKESIRGKLTQPTTVKCARVEYEYRSKVATAAGGVEFRQKNRTARADKAVYDHNKELLVLSGNVRGEDEYKQTFSAPGTVTISLKKGSEWMEAENASASFKIDLDEDDDAEQNPTAE